MLFYFYLCGFSDQRRKVKKIRSNNIIKPLKKSLNKADKVYRKEMVNKNLVDFIKEARKRGFDDYQIKEPLLKHGWPIEEIEKGFFELRPKYTFKNKITVFVDNKVLKIIEKRAKRNMFTIGEQIEDILRRSCVRLKPVKKEEKLDDLLVGLFSRKKS